MLIRPESDFGKVHVEALIGEGVSSEVYRGYYRENKKQVALKLIKSRILTDPQSRERVRREIEILLKFQSGHPNIVQLYEKIDTPDYFGYLMEYLPYGSLEELLKRTHTLEAAHILTVLSDITRGLHQLHKNSIIHRDIKPANILFDINMRAKISDFGTSYRNSNAPLTKRGDLVGTIAYAAPEYLRQGVFDERADLFAVGVIAYELATGKNPYEEGNLLKHIIQKSESPPTPPKEIAPGCPQGLSDFIMKALAIDPDERFQTSLHMFKSLQSPKILENA